MRKVLKVLGFGALLAAFAAPVFAQQDECATLYETYTSKYKGSLEDRKAAVAAGEQYIAKCNTPDNKQQIDYLTARVPKLKEANQREEAVTGFNKSLEGAKNVNEVKVDDAFKYGKQVIAFNPDLVDVPLVLASIGFDKAAANPPVDTYNAEAINYAKQAIQMLESGKTSKQHGAYIYTYTTKEYPDGKSNALAWMNYTIGYIMYNRQNQKKEALPYYYKAIQYNSAVKKNPGLYQAIGSFYLDEYNRIDDERTKLAEQAKTETDEEKKKQLIDKAKELLALQKGYADRIIDAYARAYTLAPASDKAYKDSLYNILKGAYNFRFDGKTDGLDALISSVTNKPLPDPMSPVTPVVETTTATTTPSTTSSTAPTANTSKPATNGATTATTVTKPANGTTTTATKPANGATTNTNGATTKTPASKPAPKKKNNR